MADVQNSTKKRKKGASVSKPRKKKASSSSSSSSSTSFHADAPNASFPESSQPSVIDSSLIDSMKQFISLYEGTFKNKYNEKDFATAFGVSPSICAFIWAFLSEQNRPLKFKRKHLLWGLYYVKNYTPTDHEAFKVCGRTFRTWAAKILQLLYEQLSVVTLKSRLETPSNLHPALSKLTLRCSTLITPIRRPTDPEHQRDFYSSVHKGCVLKYEFCTRPKDGRICWGYGAATGATTELKMLNDGQIWNFIQDNELLLGSTRLSADPRVIAINREKFMEYAAQNHVPEAEALGFLERTERNHERTAELLKSFKYLTRICRNEMEQHKIGFLVCLHLVNMILTEEDDEGEGDCIII